jgi:hypothetical protein
MRCAPACAACTPVTSSAATYLSAASLSASLQAANGTTFCRHPLSAAFFLSCPHSHHCCCGLQEPSSFYHVVTGPPGGGKSTLLRAACRELGRGVGYVDVNPAFEVDFGKDLGHAFNFRCGCTLRRAAMRCAALRCSIRRQPNRGRPFAASGKKAAGSAPRHLQHSWLAALLPSPKHIALPHPCPPPAAAADSRST